MPPKKPTSPAQARAIELVCRWQDHGDLTARNEVVSLHIPLVRKLVKRCKSARGRHFDDALHEGVLAVMRAADKFNPHKSNSFGAYATMWVWSAVQRHLQKQKLVTPASSTGRHIWSNLGAVSRELRSEGKAVEAEDAAAVLGTSVESTRAVLALFLAPVSLDAPIPGSKYTLGDSMRAGVSVEDEVSDALLWRARTAGLQAALDALSPRERDIVVSRYLQDEDEQQSLAQMGAKWGISHERTRQIEGAALCKIYLAMSAGRATAKYDAVARVRSW